MLTASALLTEATNRLNGLGSCGVKIRKRWMLSLASWQVTVIPIHFGVGFEFWNGMDMFLVSMDYTCVNLGKQVWLSYV